MIDAVDRQILSILQESARIANAEIARQVGMAPSAVYERIRKLEERGYVEGYPARLSANKLGCGLLAFIFVRTQERVGSGITGAALAQLPEVQEVHHVAGEDCYLVKVRVAGTEALGAFIRDRLSRIETIRSTRTTIVLATVKESTHIPLEDFAGEREYA